MIAGSTLEGRTQIRTAAPTIAKGGVQNPSPAAGPLAAVLGQELQTLTQREAELQQKGGQRPLGKRTLRDVEERIAELKDGIEAVKP